MGTRVSGCTQQTPMTPLTPMKMQKVLSAKSWLRGHSWRTKLSDPPSGHPRSNKQSGLWRRIQALAPRPEGTPDHLLVQRTTLKPEGSHLPSGHSLARHWGIIVVSSKTLTRLAGDSSNLCRACEDFKGETGKTHRSLVTS